MELALDNPDALEIMLQLLTALKIPVIAVFTGGGYGQLALLRGDLANPF